MKKILFIIVTAIVLFGCDKKYYSVNIENKSNRQVFYTYDGKNDSINIDETKIYTNIEAYTQPPKNISDTNKVSSIEIYTNGMTGNYTFLYKGDKDLIKKYYNRNSIEKYIIEVQNLLVDDVYIKADNFICDLSSIDTPLYLFVGANNKSTAIIYTNNPNFLIYKKENNNFAPYSFSALTEWELNKYETPTLIDESFYVSGKLNVTIK